MPTAAEVAAFMIEQIHDLGRVEKRDMVDLVEERFGAGTEIDDIVRARFRRTHAGRIRWVSHGEYWESLLPRDQLG